MDIDLACVVEGLLEDRYRISKDGSVWSRLRGKWKKVTPFLLDGQAYVALCLGERKVHRAVGALVLTAFVGPRPPRHQCWHFPDSDPFNNALANVRWAPTGTSRVGRRLAPIPPRRVGSEHIMAKLTEEKVLRARDLYRQGSSILDIAEFFGVTTACIQGALTGKTWSHVVDPKGPVKMRRGGPSGSGHMKAKLEEADVLEIRRLARSGLTGGEICRRYTISISSLHSILKRVNWRKLHDPMGDESIDIPFDLVRGSMRPNAKLNEGKVVHILQLHRTGMLQTEIAKHMGVDPSIINKIVNGKRWKHVSTSPET